MAQEYKISKVSEQEPRKWQNPQGGYVYYIKVMLEGYDKPVSVGKKAPDGLKVGDTLYGHIEESDLPEDKFKSERRPFSPGGGYQRDDMAIRAQWAIGQAVQLAMAAGVSKMAEDDLEEQAVKLFLMVDRVKVVQPNTKKPDPVYEPEVDEEINLDEIPF